MCFVVVVVCCTNYFASMLQGSQNQLKEVWEEADGLDPEDFDPKTFFNLHGKTFTNRQLPRYYSGNR